MYRTAVLTVRDQLMNRTSFTPTRLRWKNDTSTVLAVVGSSRAQSIPCAILRPTLLYGGAQEWQRRAKWSRGSPSRGESRTDTTTAGQPEQHPGHHRNEQNRAARRQARAAIKPPPAVVRAT